MTSERMKRLMRQVDSLSVDERLLLASYLLKRTGEGGASDSIPRKKWGEICGIASFPPAGEDAQDWVTRTRRESDERRAAQLELRR